MKIIVLVASLSYLTAAPAQARGRESTEQAFTPDTSSYNKKSDKDDCSASIRCVGKGLEAECSKWSLDQALSNAKDTLAECMRDMKKECDNVGGAFLAAEASPFEFLDDKNANRGTALVITRGYTCNACAKKK